MVNISFQEKYCLHLYSVNGRQLTSVPLEEQVTALYVAPDHAIMGTSKGNLQIRDLTEWVNWAHLQSSLIHQNNVTGRVHYPMYCMWKGSFW